MRKGKSVGVREGKGGVGEGVRERRDRRGSNEEKRCMGRGWE